MKLEEINPFIRYYAIHSSYLQTQKNSVCYDCRLFFVIEGSGKFFIENTEYPLNPYTMIYLPPKTCYRFQFDDSNSIKLLIINYDLTSDFSHISDVIGISVAENYDEKRLLKYDLPTELSKPIIQYNREDALEKLQKCMDVYNEKNTYYSQISSALLKLILFDMLLKNQPENNNPLKEIISYIYSDYKNFYLSNATIAQRFNYHPVYLNRIFKEYTNQTIHQFLINLRLNKAKELLLTTLWDITKISEEVGFLSYTHFIKVFREKFEIPPQQYRKAHKYRGY